MKPSPAELVIFRTISGLSHVGGYIPYSNKWHCDLYNEDYHNDHVVEWWPMPEDSSGNKNNCYYKVSEDHNNLILDN